MPVVRLNPNSDGLDTALVVIPKLFEDASEDAEPPSDLLSVAFLVLNGGETSCMHFSTTYDPAVLKDRLRGPEYEISQQIPLSDRDLLTNLGEIAGSALAVRAFADHYSSLEHGKVNQSLASAFRELYKQYLSALSATKSCKSLLQLYVQLQQFGVHLINARELIKLFEATSPHARHKKHAAVHDNFVGRAAMSQFVSHNDGQVIIRLRGGEVLRFIAELLHREMGDPVIRNLYEELLRIASVPYLEMMRLWITYGLLQDPFSEFMIQETRKVHGWRSLDDYWDKRYTIRPMDVPLQLSDERTHDMLLVCGKYLNVLRDQGVLDENTCEPLERARKLIDQCETIEDARVLDAISIAYRFANQEILQLLRRASLSSLLSKLGEVFFLESDFYASFADEARSQLYLPASGVDLDALERALAQVKPDSDKWNDCIGVALADQSLPDTLISVVIGKAEEDLVIDNSKLLGIDVIQFDFEVPFPLSLVVTRGVIARYQYLFRHLVTLMTAREALCESFVGQPKPPPVQFQFRPVSMRKEKFLDQPQHWLLRTGVLRQRLLYFVDLLIAQSTYEGIVPEHAQFKQHIDDAEELGELNKLLITALDRSLMASLLSDSAVIRIQSRLLSLCHQFQRLLDNNVELIQYFSDTRAPPLLDEDGQAISREETLGWYAETLEKYESVLDRNLERLIERLKVLIPKDFVSGVSIQLLLSQLEPLRMKKLREDEHEEPHRDHE